MREPRNAPNHHARAAAGPRRAAAFGTTQSSRATIDTSIVSTSVDMNGNG